MVHQCAAMLVQLVQPQLTAFTEHAHHLFHLSLLLTAPYQLLDLNLLVPSLRKPLETSCEGWVGGCYIEF